MQKLLSPFIVAAFALTGLTTTAADGIYGQWGGLPDVPAHGITLSITMQFDPGKVTATNHCKYFDGVVVPVSTSVAAQYTATTITTLGSSSNTASVNGHSCDVSIQPVTLNYTLNGDSLTLSANGQTFTVKRIK